MQDKEIQELGDFYWKACIVVLRNSTPWFQAQYSTHSVGKTQFKIRDKD